MPRVEVQRDDPSGNSVPHVLMRQAERQKPELVIVKPSSPARGSGRSHSPKTSGRKWA